MPLLRGKIYYAYDVQTKSSCPRILSDEATPWIEIHYCSRIRTFGVTNVTDGIIILAVMMTWWTDGWTIMETLHARSVYEDTIWRNTLTWLNLAVLLVNRAGLVIVSYTKTFWSIEYTTRR